MTAFSKCFQDVSLGQVQRLPCGYLETELNATGEYFVYAHQYAPAHADAHEKFWISTSLLRKMAL